MLVNTLKVVEERDWSSELVNVVRPMSPVSHNSSEFGEFSEAGEFSALW